MARVEAVANLDVRQWSLTFDKGWRRSLRVGGFFAGYPSKNELLDGIKRQEQRDERHRRESADEGVPLSNIEEELDTASNGDVGDEDDGAEAEDGEERERERSRSPLASPESTVFHTRQSQTSEVRNGRRNKFRVVEEDDVEKEEEQEEEEEERAFEEESPENDEGDAEVAMDSPVDPDFDGADRAREADDFAGSEGSFEMEPPMPADSFEMEPSMDTSEVNDFFITTRSSDGNYTVYSFMMLPMEVNGQVIPEEDSMGEDCPSHLYLNGIFDDDQEARRRKIGKWKLTFPLRDQPVFLVENRDGAWVTLCQPHETYRPIMNSARAAASFLHYVNRNPGTSKETSKKELAKLCRRHPSDEAFAILSNYLPWIIEAACGLFPRQVVLAIERTFPTMFREIAEYSKNGGKGKGKAVKRRKSTYGDILAFPSPSKPTTASKRKVTNEKKKRKSGQKDKQPVAMNGNNSDDSVDFDVNQLYEDPPVCALCDDGGNSLFCEGPCQRSFHPNSDAGHASYCDGLGMTDLEVQSVNKFFCQNCLYNQHQCFICGELGSSAVSTASSPQEVYCCGLPFCFRFYHLKCLADFCHPLEQDLEEIQSNPERLICPRHTCKVCGLSELQEPGELVQCRRCPRGWHKKCLKDYIISRENPQTPIWHQYSREYLYCSFELKDIKLDVCYCCSWRFSDLVLLSVISLVLRLQRYEALAYLSTRSGPFAARGYLAAWNDKASKIPRTRREYPYDNLCLELGGKPD